MRTQVVVFPFDLFGSGGTAAGAQLLGDALIEMVDDTRLETQPVRQASFARSIDFEEIDLHTLGTIGAWATLGREAIENALRADFALWLSGNHLGCLPVYNALDRETLIIQFDAHLDCYDLHDTHQSLSHGNFLRHREGKSPIVNVGHRDLFLSAKTIRQHFVEVVAAEALAFEEAKALASLRKRIAKTKEFWLDIDVDVFDPSICPAVHSPMPFGLLGPQVLKLLQTLDFSKLRGVSISEFDPGRDARDASLNMLGWLLEWILLKKYKA